MGKRLTTYTFIEKSNFIHKNKYDYSLVKYINNKTKVSIICKEHGIFEQLPINHINSNSGCPKCYGNIKMSIEEFTKKSNFSHNDKYDYSLVKYINNKTKVSIICKGHGIFEQSPDSHLKGHGCPSCGIKMNTNILLEKLKNIYNNKYDYSLVNYINSKTPINIICKEHGIVSIKIENILYNKSGCTYCNGVYKDISDFINDANVIHSNKYNYKIINNLSKNSYIEIICKKHGSFRQRISSHIYDKIGCKKCVDDYKRKDLNVLLDDFRKTHNDKYDYSLVLYKNTNIKVNILCKKHGLFKQTPKLHINGSGCPSCNESKGENKIDTILSNSKIYYIRQKTFEDCKNKGLLRFDFYIPSMNICIEYDGEQHFNINEYFGGEKEFNNIKQNDEIKNKYCIENNINLIRIPYYDFNNIDNILNKITTI